MDFFFPVVHLCQLFVVKYFYNDLNESLFREAIDRHTGIHQNTSNGSATVTIVPTAPNSSGFQFRDGDVVVPDPDRFMTVPFRHPHSGTVVYPRLHEPTRGQMPHEYNNPPAYSPAYDPRMSNPPGENVSQKF